MQTARDDFEGTDPSLPDTVSTFIAMVACGAILLLMLAA